MFTAMSAGRRKQLASWLTTRDPAWLELGRLGTLAYLTMGCAVVVGWHSMFAQSALYLDASPRYTATPGFQGMYTRQIQPFFYFYHYTGYFPISWTGDPHLLIEREDRARVLIEPRQIRRPVLVNEVYTVVRKGDLAQLFLLYPDFWSSGKAAHATARTFNRWLALAASLALFVSLSLCHRKLFGLLLIAVMGSNPFQLVQIYQSDEVWSYPINVAALMLALCAPLVFLREPKRWHFAIPLAAGIFLATAREVRTEPALLIVSVVIACLWAPGAWRHRAALLVVLGMSLYATSEAWSTYWHSMLEEAVEVVEAAGGTPFKGQWNLHHSLWHPLWYGLGDFGQDKGYMHSDKAAYKFAIPILNAKYGTKYRYGGFLFKNTDETGLRIKPETVPEYQLVLRDKILGDIRESPGWYLGILAKRFHRIFERANPVRIAYGAQYVEFRFSAWLTLPLLALVFALRSWNQVKLLLWYTPTSLPPFLIHARGGLLNPTAFHMMAFVLVATWALLAALRALPSLRARFASAADRLP